MKFLWNWFSFDTKCGVVGFGLFVIIMIAQNFTLLLGAM